MDERALRPPADGSARRDLPPPDPAPEPPGVTPPRPEPPAPQPAVPPPTVVAPMTNDEPSGAEPVAAPDGDQQERASGKGHRQVVRFRWRQRIVWFVGLVIVLGLVYVVVSIVQVWATGRADDRDPVDAIVVMGAAQFDGRPSPTLAARLDHVLEIWPDDVAPLVVTTGGNLPGDRFTEAETSANYLVANGVPREAILLEDSGGTSYESLEGVAALLDARGLDEVVIVTDPYHALRSKLIAESFGLDASTSSTTTSVVTGADSFRRHLVEGAGIAVGRIVGFERLDAWTN